MSSPKRTRALPFFSCDAQQTALLTVNPNIPIADALEASGAMLDCVTRCLEEHAFDLGDADYDADPRLAWALSYLTEFACAIQSACVTATKKEQSQ